MVTEWKINIITSWCVLGINLNKIDISKIEFEEGLVICNCSLHELFKRNSSSWENIQVWLIPELEKLQKGWININACWLKISWETKIIWLHNVLLDGFDEVCRVWFWLKAIGSTWSGISRAYASESQRYHFTLNDLLNHPDTFYDSIKCLWLAYAQIFPKISIDELIWYAKKERKEIIEYIKNWTIEIIENEKQYIKWLHKKWKKIIWEGAQASMIGAENSYFWTASDPSLWEFCRRTWLTVKKVWNILLVHKLPPSSVWERPWYLKIPDSPELDEFRKKYQEFWVSTGRQRDLFYHSLPETARWAWLNVRGIDDEEKIVPVYNRVDGITDSLKLDNWLLRMVIGFRYNVGDILKWNFTKDVGVLWNKLLNPKNLLSNYPEKSWQLWLFWVEQEDLRFIEMDGDNIEEQIEQLLWYYNASIFRKDEEREFLIWTWQGRDDLELRKGAPLRNFG